MTTLIKNISSLVTVSSGGKLFKTGSEMQDVGEIKNGAMLFDEKIIWTGTTAEAEDKIKRGEFKPEKEISLTGRTVMPGFVDSHSHVVFAGNRSGEFAKRLRGATYTEIAADGGGILATVKATRAASIDELAENGRALALSALKHGTTALEIKSGYSLNLEGEIKQLRAIRKLQNELPMLVVSTFLGAHDFPPEFKGNKDGYMDLMINEMLPAVAGEGLAEFCDAFVDKGYYTCADGVRLFTRAKELGFKIKCHADELADVSAAEMAAGMGAVSADHLLFVSDKSIEALKQAGTVATLMPGTAFFIRMPYAPARKIIESDAIVALASDCNPGSCFTENMQAVLSLAVINMHMTAEEAICAATLNGARAIGRSDTIGSLEPGKLADFIILDVDSYTGMFYHFGVNHVSGAWIGGQKVL